MHFNVNNSLASLGGMSVAGVGDQMLSQPETVIYNDMLASH